MLDARDAYLAADRMRFGGANQAELWRAFARRGFGAGAVAHEHGRATATPIRRRTSRRRCTSNATVTFTAVAPTRRTRPSRARDLRRPATRRAISPIADTNPATTRSPNLDDDGGVRAGHVRVRRPGAGATATSASAPHVRGRPDRDGHVLVADELGVDGQGRDGVRRRHPDRRPDRRHRGARTGSATGAQPDVQGRQVTVDLERQRRRRSRRVQVSAMLAARARTASRRCGSSRSRRASRTRRTRTARCRPGARRGYTSPADAFPGVAPRPAAPELLLRELRRSRRRSRRRTCGSSCSTNQCTGNAGLPGRPGQRSRRTAPTAARARPERVDGRADRRPAAGAGTAGQRGPDRRAAGVLVMRRPLLTATVRRRLARTRGRGGGARLDHPAPPAVRRRARDRDQRRRRRRDVGAADTFPTGNPHTDIDFFTQSGETYASVGTLGDRPERGRADHRPAHASGGEIEPAARRVATRRRAASAIRPPRSASSTTSRRRRRASALAQHPRTRTPYAPDAQLLIDATDAPGRCHDQGDARRRPARRRAGSRSSTSPNVADAGRDRAHEPHRRGAYGQRRPEAAAHRLRRRRPTRSASTRTASGRTRSRLRRLDLDGFEIVDLSLVHGLPRGHDASTRSATRCRPEGLPLPLPEYARCRSGHTLDAARDLRLPRARGLPDDLLTCASGNALIVLDMSGAFDDNGTPTDFSDDKPKGKPLPCTAPQLHVPPVRHRRQDHRLRRRRGRRRDDLVVGEWLAAARPRWRASAGSAASTTRAADPGAPPTPTSTRPRTSTSTTRPS